MISKVNLYIDELLLQSNCVVVPFLGGFIANYMPAQYNATTNLYYPPSKQILFNKNLVSNDGLLCSYIAEKEKISFSEALAKIENTVFAIKQSLDSGFQVEIINFGILFSDSESSIQFKRTNTENFLIEAFGLPSFYVQTKSAIKTKPEVVFTNRPAIPSEKRQKSNSIKKYWPAFVFIPLAIGLVIFQNKTNFLGKLNVNVASWNPISNSEPVADTIYIRLKQQPKKFASNFTVKGTKTSAIETHADTATVIEKVQKEAVIIKEVAVAINKTNKFYIVAGCFQSEKNANKLIKKLQHKNYNATIIGKNESGLYRVAVAGFTTKEQADTELLNVKNNIDTAWILSL